MLADAYVVEMQNDYFIPTHQGIAIFENGEIADGQHRLEAIMRSGKSQWLLTSRNVPLLEKRGKKTIFVHDVIDRVTIRSIADEFARKYKIKNAARVAATIAAIIQLANKGKGRKASIPIALTVMKKLGDSFGKTFESIEGPGLRLPIAPILAVFVIAAGVNLDKAIDFERKYFSGIGLEVESPILTLRNFVWNKWNTVRGGGSRYQLMLMGLNAVMYFFEDQPMKRVKGNEAGLDYFSEKHKELEEIYQMTHAANGKAEK